MTVYKDLELKKSAYTRRTLAEIRSGLVIDGNSLVPEFIEDDTPVIVGAKSEEWKTCHIRQWQYILQIAKCTDPKCCLSFQLTFLKDFYHHLYQLFTHVTKLNWQKMTKMLPTYPCIRIFPCRTP